MGAAGADAGARRRGLAVDDYVTEMSAAGDVPHDGPRASLPWHEGRDRMAPWRQR